MAKNDYYKLDRPFSENEVHYLNYFTETLYNLSLIVEDTYWDCRGYVDTNSFPEDDWYFDNMDYDDVDD